MVAHYYDDILRLKFDRFFFWIYIPRRVQQYKGVQRRSRCLLRVVLRHYTSWGKGH